jgi:hypothetical protein
MFFFEKKNQKTFAIGAVRRWCKTRRAVGMVEKVFCFFFSKKKAFLKAPPPESSPAPAW